MIRCMMMRLEYWSFEGVVGKGASPGKTYVPSTGVVWFEIPWTLQLWVGWATQMQWLKDIWLEIPTSNGRAVQKASQHLTRMLLESLESFVALPRYRNSASTSPHRTSRLSDPN